jgi:hypothetical protein
MWLAHVTIGPAAISLLVAFAFGGGFDVARTGLREIYSRVNFWEKEPQEQ